MNNLIQAQIDASISGDLETISETTVNVVNAMSGHSKLKRGTSDIVRFLAKICFGPSDCWLWRASRDGGGYGTVAYRGRVSKAHRVSWCLFRSEIPPGIKVLHKCDVRNCVNPDHLFLGTQADNVQDMMKKGRQRTTPKYGEQNPMSRLTAHEVLEMREIRQRTGMSAKRLGERFGVSTMTAHRAINKISWSTI